MKTAVFTIISNNYSAQARTLMQSLRRHEPEWERHVLVVDSPLPEKLIEADEASLRYSHSLPLPVPRWFFFQYSVLEANTAVKPWMFERLFAEGYEAVIYFDPDIQLFSSLTELKTRLPGESILLTPHLLEPYRDDAHPSEKQIRQAGIHNLGFAAMRWSPEVKKALDWWKEKLTHDCRQAVHEGVFVDQSWMDFAPGFFKARLLEDPGYNVAYWNLHERILQAPAAPHGRPLCNGGPLGFFHFSGFDYRAPSVLSRHQNRFHAGNLPEETRAILQNYATCLKENGIETIEKIPYALNQIDGLRLPEYLRHTLVQDPAVQAMILNNTAVPNFSGQLMDYLSTPDPAYPQLPRFIARLLALRIDLQNYFKVPGLQLCSHSLPDWFKHVGRHEMGIGSAFSGEGWWTEETPRQKKIRFLRKKTAGFISTQSPLARQFDNLLQASYLKHARSPYREPGQRRASPKKPPRINLFGYFLAASGMGEVARSTSRALSHLGLDHRIINLDHQGRKKSCDLLFGLPDSQAEIDIAAVNADVFPAFVRQFPEHPSFRRYRVGYWLWEMETPPPGFFASEKLVDEIWTASEANAATFRHHSRLPIRVAGLNLSGEWTKTQSFPFPEIDRSGRCLFVTLCDCLSYPERKNPAGALRAYLEAFPQPGSDSLLLIKIQNGHHRPETIHQLHELAGQRRDIVIRDAMLSDGEIVGMLQHCDVLISLHAHEGFGLPIAEALTLGKEVVVTAYGGNMDFCHAENSRLVPFELFALEQDIGPYLKGNHWARPDLAAAAKILRQVHQSWKEKRLSRKPSDLINEKNYRHIAENIQAITERISS